MIFEDSILTEMKEAWPHKWQEVRAYFEKKEEEYEKYSDNVKEKMDHPKITLLSRIKGAKLLREHELKILNKCIPKNQLEDGVTYISTGCTLCRFICEARWDQKIGKFKYMRDKFGLKFEDEIEHFVDVIDTGYAGFTPIKKK